MPERHLVCIHCGSPVMESPEGLECPACGAGYPVVGGVPVFLPDALTDQQRKQTIRFDAEFAGYQRYEPENWRLSFNQRIFGALGMGKGAGRISTSGSAAPGQP